MKSFYAFLRLFVIVLVFRLVCTTVYAFWEASHKAPDTYTVTGTVNVRR